MKPHIAQTIEDIELKIGFLQRLAGALRELGTVTDLSRPPASSSEPVPVTPIPTARTAARLAMGEKINRATKPRREAGPVEKSGGGKHDLQDRIRNALAAGKIVEPFHSVALADALKLDRVPVTSALKALEISGELTLAGKDGLKKLYRRTNKLKKPGEPSAGEKLLAEIHQEIASAKPNSN